MNGNADGLSSAGRYSLERAQPVTFDPEDGNIVASRVHGQQQPVVRRQGERPLGGQRVNARAEAFSPGGKTAGLAQRSIVIAMKHHHGVMRGLVGHDTDRTRGVSGGAPHWRGNEHGNNRHKRGQKTEHG